jgi:hypothetical protein
MPSPYQEGHPLYAPRRCAYRLCSAYSTRLVLQIQPGRVRNPEPRSPCKGKTSPAVPPSPPKLRRCYRLRRPLGKEYGYLTGDHVAIWTSPKREPPRGFPFGPEYCTLGKCMRK